MNFKKHYILLASFVLTFFLISVFTTLLVEAKEGKIFYTKKYEEERKSLEERHKKELRELEEKHNFKALEERQKEQLRALKERYKAEENELKKQHKIERDTLRKELSKKNNGEDIEDVIEKAEGKKEIEVKKESFLDKIKRKFKRDK